MGFFNRFERSLGRFAIPHLPLYLVGGQVLFWSVSFLGFFDLERIALLPVAVPQEPWRLISFLLLPPVSHPVFIAFAWYLFYLMGSALENYWGVFRFNLFILLGWALTVAAAFINPQAYATNLFLGGSVFLAFAILNPEFEMLIFFILPVKIKWLALIQWITYAYLFVVGRWSVRFAILAAVGNIFVFFARDILQRLRSGQRRAKYQAQQVADQAEPRHRCVVCGKTDRTHPQEDFRYCSQCANEECYCSEHIRNHTHTVKAGAKE